ncbi:MAG: hypothetical protein HOW73_49970, partial [Polyangiaceae bacterium]|nr:hypothetical protein [Polyangiaceae bacterium]
MEETRVKGQGFRGIIAAVESQHGKGALERARAAMDPDVRLDGIVASGWYPMSWYRELHRAAAIAIPGVPDLAFELGKEAMRKDLRGVYRFILSILGPDRSFSHAERVLSTYFEGARFEVVERRPDGLTARFFELRGMDDACWNDLLGGTTIVAEAPAGRGGRLRR